ncbi:hypothetical protein [Sphingomonas sp.]|uniref:hypothetical protein n=1 Tax=Sphingomonas sp. TaxID=28214 RepID=UPI00286BA5BE|nr:hypothetical protein [Sphingomonas sp.]
MRLLTLSIAVIALAACQKTTTTTTTTNEAANTTDINVVDANMTNASAPAAALTTLNETSWEFNQKGKDVQESVDATGKYITVSGKEHIDHGTAVMKDGKGCHTSAMNKDGEVCWTDPLIAEGGSGVTVSDKGEKLPIKRIAYVPHTM